MLPAHRGNGYADDLLAEGTRILAEQDVPRIRAATDLGNVPMANAFQRARSILEYSAPRWEFTGGVIRRVSERQVKR